MVVMQKEKFVLTFIVAVAIIVGGYFLAGTDPDGFIAAEKKMLGNKLGLDSALQESGLDGGSGQAGALYMPTDANGNITKMVAQSMFLKMRQLDAKGDSPFDGIDPQNALTAEMIGDTVENIPGSIFEVKIDTKDIKITKDNTKSAKMKYIEGIDRITQKRFLGAAGTKFKPVSSEAFLNNFNTDCFEAGTSEKNIELSAAYLEIYNDYKNLTVPYAWMDMHKMILAHFKELSDIYGAFTQCKDDPIRAYVAIDRLPEVVAETADIQKVINKKASELGIR